MYSWSWPTFWYLDRQDTPSSSWDMDHSLSSCWQTFHICDPILENGAYGAISGFWVTHICMLCKTFPPFCYCLYVCTIIPSRAISKNANNTFIGYFWEKAIFHWMHCFRSRPFMLNWPRPLLFQNGVFLVASREKVSLTSLLHLQLTLYT